MMTKAKKPLTPEGKRIMQYRNAAASELGVEADDPLAIRQATLRMAHDTVQAAVAAGNLSAVDYLLKLEAAMAELRAAVPVRHTVKVEFV
jgi:hypothetical protein